MQRPEIDFVRCRVSRLARLRLIARRVLSLPLFHSRGKFLETVPRSINPVFTRQAGRPDMQNMTFRTFGGIFGQKTMRGVM